MRFRQSSETEQYPVDPRVPPAASWPIEGIVGRIGRGTAQGEWVLAEPYWDSVVGNGPAIGYALDLPHRQLFDLDGNYLLDDGCYDSFRPSGEGGFIDLLTTALDIEWSTDEAVVSRERARCRSGD